MKRFKEAANRVIAPGKTTVSAPACGKEVVVVTVLVTGEPQLVAALAALELEEELAAAAEAAEALGQFCEETTVLLPLPAEADAEELALELELEELDEPELEPEPEPLLLPEPALPLAPAEAEPEAPAPAEAEPLPAEAEAELDELELELEEELELEFDAALTMTGIASATLKATKMETKILFIISIPPFNISLALRQVVYSLFY